MAKLVSVFISARRQHLIMVGMGLIVFAALALGASMLAVAEVRRAMIAESRTALEPFARARKDIDDTFDALRQEVTATPCTPLFISQMRRVGFRPDMFSEFLYAPGGMVRCATSAPNMPEAFSLGTPQLDHNETSGTSIWVDRELSFAGLPNLVGSIALRGDFGVIIPVHMLTASMPSWLAYEVVLLTDVDDQHVYRAGEVNLFEEYELAHGPEAPLLPRTLRTKVCDDLKSHCVVAQVRPAEFVMVGGYYIAVAIVALALVAAGIAVWGKSKIVRYWSFESRFRRHLDSTSIICAYQPLVAVGTGEIVGCEILARWRDVDDSVVYPDNFIPLVERSGLTEKLTRLVVERACVELCASIPADRRLKLTFNIFPCDLDSDLILDIFKPFDKLRDRFDIVVEIIESDQVSIPVAQRHIEALRAAGVKTYIDDFGTGYSNIQNLAALAVDGVKLDRAFAMAETGTMMARMLGLAIEMIHASGRDIVIEGVETSERLDDLRHIVPPIDFAQGYHISRPLDIECFANFLATRKSNRPPLHMAA